MKANPDGGAPLWMMMSAGIAITWGMTVTALIVGIVLTSLPLWFAIGFAPVWVGTLLGAAAYALDKA